MITVYLIRHGEIAGNEGPEPIYAGCIDLPLNEQGKHQSAALANYLKDVPLDAIYCSGLQRTQQTADAVARDHQLHISINPAWNEVSYGDWEGLTVPQIEAGWGSMWHDRQSDPVKVRASKGENYTDLWQRVEPAWQEILAQHHNGTIAIFTHKGPIRILLTALLGAPLDNFKRIHSSNTGISCLEMNSYDAIPLIRYINDTSHLKFYSTQF